MTSDETCADFLERIVCLLDDELDGGQVAEVKAHLDECAPCLQSYPGDVHGELNASRRQQ